MCWSINEDDNYIYIYIKQVLNKRDLVKKFSVMLHRR